MMKGKDKSMSSNDLLFPVAEKDADTLLKNLPYHKKHLPYTRIVVVGKKSLEPRFADQGVLFVDEDAVYPGLSYAAVRGAMEAIVPGSGKRTGWYLQQFIKMTYAFYTQSESYLIWDADTLPLRELSFVSAAGKYQFNTVAPIHKPYFDTMARLFDPPLTQQIPESFINEHMMIDSAIMRELLQRIDGNAKLPGDSLFEKILRAVTPEELPASGFSEYETYGTYVYSYHPEKAELRKLNTLRNGRSYFGDTIQGSELRWLARSFDSVSFDQWDIPSKKQFVWRNPVFRALFSASEMIAWKARFSAALSRIK